jgi:hypothetical protein
MAGDERRDATQAGKLLPRTANSLATDPRDIRPDRRRRGDRMRRRRLAHRRRRPGQGGQQRGEEQQQVQAIHRAIEATGDNRR